MTRRPAVLQREAAADAASIEALKARIRRCELAELVGDELEGDEQALRAELQALTSRDLEGRLRRMGKARELLADRQRKIESAVDAELRQLVLERCNRPAAQLAQLLRQAAGCNAVIAACKASQLGATLPATLGAYQACYSIPTRWVSENRHSIAGWQRRGPRASMRSELPLTMAPASSGPLAGATTRSAACARCGSGPGVPPIPRTKRCPSCGWQMVLERHAEDTVATYYCTNRACEAEERAA
jgi:hypothetical protein